MEVNRFEVFIEYENGLLKPVHDMTIQGIVKHYGYEDLYEGESKLTYKDHKDGEYKEFELKQLPTGVGQHMIEVEVYTQEGYYLGSGYYEDH